ncbi:hypothetical protein CASFOL_041201 [Castilleja foliolosa]|uniref:Uncharacterized protein n=1 Tax=Castilleja foliolosa TaxID=1961234 RepID=A0ABD3BDU0_9LAMI
MGPGGVFWVSSLEKKYLNGQTIFDEMNYLNRRKHWLIGRNKPV